MRKPVIFRAKHAEPVVEIGGRAIAFLFIYFPMILVALGTLGVMK